MKLFFQLVLICACHVSAACAAEVFQLQSYARQIQLSGLTRPVRMMTVHAEISGRCRAVLVDVAERVPDAGVVAELDDTFIQLDLAKNRISQDKARRQLEEEKKNLDRYTALISKNSTAQATYDEALLQADIYRYSLQMLQVEESQLREQLARSRMTGPQGWTVIRRFSEPGEYIRQGEPVLELGDFRQLLVTFLLTPQQVSALQGMDRIQLFFAELTDPVQAELHTISPVSDPVSKKIEVELLVNGLDHPALRGGLQAQLILPGERVADQFVAPASALESRYEAHWLRSEDGTKHKVILLGYSAGGRDAVVSGGGLAAGQSYLAQPVAGANHQP